MNSIINWVSELPLWQATLFMFAGVFCRAQTTFWIGKFAHLGIIKTNWGKKKIDSEDKMGMLILKKYGWPIIPLSFLTVGLQSVIQLGAGLLDWKWLKYTLAALPGYVVWAFVYAFGGLSLFNSIVKGSIGLLITAVIVILAFSLIGKIIVKKFKTN